MMRAEDQQTGDADNLSASPSPCVSETKIGSEQHRVVEQIAALETLSLIALRKRWSRLFNASVPSGLSSDLMIRGIAYKIQEQAFGGLSQATKRKLGTFAKQLEGNSRKGFEAGPNLKPGAKLIREWQAQTYLFDVSALGTD